MKFHPQSVFLRFVLPAQFMVAAGAAAGAVHYVDANSTGSALPFLTWATAARTIQEAVDAAATGDEIVVTNGIYAAGGRAVCGTMTNRVVVDKTVTVCSVNGPQFTVIEGRQVPGATNGASAIRCVYLTNGAVLSGFTLTNGATRRAGDYDQEQSGGAVWSESTNTLVTNCVLSGNSAYDAGGGAFRGTLDWCVLSANSAQYDGGGAYDAALNHCTLSGNSAASGGGTFEGALNHCVLSGNSADTGGGVYRGSLNNCTLTANIAYTGGAAYLATLDNSRLTDNLAVVAGGGAAGCTMSNCTLSGNSANNQGGGAYSGTLINCLLISNSTGRGAGAANATLIGCTLANNSSFTRGGGAASGCALNNCIAYFNTDPLGAANYRGGTLNCCCTTPLPASGTGNIELDPLFMDLANGNLRLQSNSPCINAGGNGPAPGLVDLDGNPRLAGGTVDIGAYEYQSPATPISYGWLQQYGLATDGSADSADPDGDGFSTWQEWLCGTNPTNASSFLRLFQPESDGTSVFVTWESAPGRSYFLLRSTNLALPTGFQLLATNLPGQAGTTIYTDINAAGTGPRFYRVGVQ